MSAEPGRKAPYSIDLRWRVVWKRIVKELHFSEIALKLDIAPSTAHRIFKEFIENGDVCPKGNKGPRLHLRKMDDHVEMFIIGLILDAPSMYLKELCTKIEEVCHVKVCEATICNLLHRHGFTRKKIRQVAIQQSVELRGKFMAEALLYRKELFVWVDETGSDNRSCMRKYGYAIKGQVPLCRRLFVRGQRLSAIAAIATDGLVCVEVTRQKVNSDILFDFLRGSLIPYMVPFDGTSPKSIVIMDNCSIHHVSEIKTLFDNVGIPVFFLPPYSPDYNPIEETFSYIKSYLREHDDLLQATGNICSVLESAFHSITAHHCLQWIKHSGYY